MKSFCALLALLHQIWLIDGSGLHAESTGKLSHRVAKDALPQSKQDDIFKQTVFPVTVNLTSLMAKMESHIQRLTERIDKQDAEIEAKGRQIASLKLELQTETKALRGEIRELASKLADVGKESELIIVKWSAKSRSRAEEACEMQGMDLASLDTQEKRHKAIKLKNQIDKDGGGRVMWVGAFCDDCDNAEEDKWVWPNGEKLDLDDPMFERGSSDHYYVYMDCESRRNGGDCKFKTQANNYDGLGYICEQRVV